MASNVAHDEAGQGVRALLETGASAEATWVRFLDGDARLGLSRLEVERLGAEVSVDEIRRALHDLRVRVVGVAIVAPGPRTRHLSVVDFDGRALSARRRREVCDGLAARLSVCLVGPGIASVRDHAEIR